MAKNTPTNQSRALALSLAVLMIVQMFLPGYVYALTDGPSQPEVHGFTQYGTSNMVDPFTGSFSYNIPLLEIPGPDGGYPINMSYSSGITMDQEASWVGLGWSLNVGVINRQMRGLPDDFDGEEVQNKKYQKPNITIGAGISGSTDFEIAGISGIGDIISFSKGMKFYYNNYNGFGYTETGGFSVGASTGGFGGSIGLNMSQDYFEGGKVSPSIGISCKSSGTKADVSGGLNIGMNFSSRYGLQGISLNASVSVTKKADASTKNYLTKHDIKDGSSTNLSVMSTNFSFSGAEQPPAIHDEMKRKAFDASLQIGGQITLANIDGEINGFWEREELAHNNEWVNNKAYGFNYLQNVKDDDAIMDFNRGSDQPVSQSVKTIAQPCLTYDIFSVHGQGIGSMLRPYRSDIGMLRDNNKASDGWSASIALETAGGYLTHVGASGFGSLSESSSGDWKQGGDIHDIYQFKSIQTDNPYYQPIAYQSYGEKHALDIEETNNLLQGLRPTYIDLSLSGNIGMSTKKALVSNSSGTFLTSTPTANVASSRIPRNISIQQFNNSELGYSDKVLQEFDVKYATDVLHAYDLNNVSSILDRSSLPQHQIGGFEAINTEGIRYVYGIPAYNLENIECSYTAKKEPSTYALSEYKVDATDIYNTGDPDHDFAGYESFMEKNRIPKYAHSFLLTSVLGPDYIDIDNNGVSDKDLGYWVKFNYLKANGDDVAAGPYCWRSPFTGGNLNERLLSKSRDDVGAYTFGKRENWYVASIETKTHVAEFYVSQRSDARGAVKEIQSLLKTGDINTILGARSYKLDSIKLYTKPERYNTDGSLNTNAVPLKVVHFEYARYSSTYSSSPELCVFKNNEGNAQNDTGKLTLKAVWFSYRNNERGKVNGYVFNYNEDDPSQNPNYSPFDYNRWGDYQPEDPNYTSNKYFPYVRQDLPKDTMDRRAAVWSLKEIELPTGARMKIQYEANDYAYVQNKPAMQMYPILQVGSTDAPFGISGGIQNYDWQSDKIYFDIPDYFSSTSEAKTFIRDNYLDNTNQFYFKIKVDLTGGRDGIDNWEYVSGYATVHDVGAENRSGNYVGYIQVDRQHVKKLHADANPLATAAWNYLLMNRPEIIQGENAIKGNPESTNKTALLGMMVDIFLTSLISIVPIVQNYYHQAVGSNFGLRIDLNNSFIRLNNSTGHKYGGGCRVKEVDVIAKNSNNLLDTLGTVYDYSTIENGKKISSGVAAYEPLIGGDENALKKALFYENKVAFRNFIPTFTELPLNESYYPAPTIGYGKVSVKSKATNDEINGVLPVSVPTTGETVYEFYTAKDYPTATSFTPIVPVGNNKGNMINYKSKIIIPILGTLNDEQLTISQGFMTEINDMHGKSKSETIYGQNAEGKLLDSVPISSKKYIYKDVDTIINGYLCKKLDNIAEVMYNDTTVSKKLLGMDYEYFGDSRMTTSSNMTVGARINVEFFIPIVLVIIPTVIPTFGEDDKTVRLATTNKIIHRFGLIDSIEEMHNGSTVKTSNELYDANTGEPVLTRLNDEYGNSTYNYTQPAYWQYTSMGPAFQNAGLEFSANVDSLNIETKYIGLHVADNKVLEYLVSGDELAIQNSSGDSYLKAYVMQTDPTYNEIWVKTKGIYGTDLIDYRKVSGLSYNIKLVRSGKRNLLNIPSGTIISKINPVLDRKIIECK